MSMLRGLLRFNRRMVHHAYQAVFPFGLVVIAACGSIIAETDDKVLSWSIDLSAMPTVLGYVFLYGACLAAIGAVVETARKSVNIIRRKVNWHKEPTLQQRIDEVTR